MIILVALLSGILAGITTRMRYLRHGLADDIRPHLKRIEDQLKRIETELELAHTTHLVEMTQLYRTQPPPPARSDDA